SSHVSEELRADFTSGNLEARSDGDAIYAIPFDAEPLAMFYSVEAFEDAGLSEGDIPETWDQFLDIADKLTDDTRFDERPATTRTSPGTPLCGSRERRSSTIPAAPPSIPPGSTE